MDNCKIYFIGDPHFKVNNIEIIADGYPSMFRTITPDIDNKSDIYKYSLSSLSSKKLYSPSSQHFIESLNSVPSDSSSSGSSRKKFSQRISNK